MEGFTLAGCLNVSDTNSYKNTLYIEYDGIEFSCSGGIFDIYAPLKHTQLVSLQILQTKHLNLLPLKTNDKIPLKFSQKTIIY